MNYRMERMTDLKRKKLWVEQETGQVNTPKKKKNYWKLQVLHGKQFKTTGGRKEFKDIGCITPIMDHYPRNGQMGDTDFSSDM